MLLLLLMLLLLFLLLWLLDLNMCNFRGRGLIEEFVQGVKSAAARHHQSDFVPKRVAEACPGNAMEDFFMLL